MKEYYAEINATGKLTRIPKPILYKVGYSSLNLSWNGYLWENITYMVHKQLMDAGAVWRLHRQAVFMPDGKIYISNLQPFVTYKFKVLIVVTALPDHVKASPDTGRIKTLAHGVPSTAPAITSLAAPTSQTISVSWTAPAFPNGMIVGYHIYLQPGRLEGQNLTTIDVPWNMNSWVIDQLRPSQKYVLSLSARNSQGEGPGSSGSVATPRADNLATQEVPLLILASGNKILTMTIQNSTQLESQNTKIIYEHRDKNVKITGISVHVRRRLVIASASSGIVSLIPLTGNTTDFMCCPGVKDAGAVSVDWLSDSLYVASQDKIYRCPLGLDQCDSVLQGLPGTVADVKVDPINGYIYYVISGEGQGLYRFALPSAEQPKEHMGFETFLSEPTPQLIITMSDLMCVMIDFDNIRLYVANSTAKTMMVASMDGSRMQTLHKEAANPNFGQVSSMIIFNQTFIWADKHKLHMDKYEPQSQKYQHSQLLLFEPPYAGLNLFHPGMQPVPAPSSAPESINAVFTTDQAIVNWKPPPLLHYQGEGAWRNWTYQLQLIKSSDSGDLLDKPQQYDISGLSLTIADLKPDSLYKLKIRASSETGFGPWSEEFIGRTLKYDGMRILISRHEGEILEKSFDGTENSIVELSSNADKMDWHEDIILWTGDEEVLFMYNRTTQQTQELAVPHKAICVAYEWLAHKVYWASQTGVILRSNLHEDRYEFICQTQANDIAIDAVSGRLYWATKFSVETSYLNGDERQEMFSLPAFSDRTIVSLTLDLASGKVLWCETSYDGHKIFELDLISSEYVGQSGTVPVEVRRLESIDSSPTIQYFSYNLFWLAEQTTLATGSSYSNHSSIVSSDENLLCFKVTHPTMHSFPSNISASNVKVIPASIQSDDLRIEGVWSRFNLTWPAETEVTYGAVFYKVFVEAVNSSQYLTTTNHFSEMSGFFPYTQLVVSVQPYTYWGYAEPTTVSLRTPTSEPTAPLSPEVYIIQHKNATASHQTLAADFRWGTPKHPNGFISHHLVTYWKEGESRTIIRLKGTARHFILTPLDKSKVYYFQVAACTEVGCGPESIMKMATTDESTSVPTLLMVSKDGISLTEIDDDLNFTSVIANITPKAATFLVKNELRVFWLDNNNTIFESSTSSIHEVVSLNGKGHDLAVDWISHTLYIVESGSLGRSSITQFNIETKDYKVLLSRSAYISNILIDPFNSILIWTELASTGQSQIMKANIQTGAAEVLLGNSGTQPRRRRSNDNRMCSCQQIHNVAQVIAMTYKGHDGATEIFFAEKMTGAIYLTDLMGCQCARIIQPTSSNAFGLPPSLLTVDHMRVSWYNTTEGKLYSVMKATGEDMVVHDVQLVDILAYGSNLQPLPDSQCLDPGPYNSSVDVLQITNTSVSLSLTAPVRPAACQYITAPVYKYTVYYRKVVNLKAGATPDDCQNDVSVCHKQLSYTTMVQITNLEPYTQYLVQVAVSTYFTEYLADILSPPVLLTTMFGVPGLVRNLNASPFTPEKILLKWESPLDFNGPLENINFVVQLWKVDSAQESIEKEIEKVPTRENMLSKIETYITQLQPDQVYNIRVLTCAGNRTVCSATEAVQCRTFKTPSAITFVNATTHSLEIKWKIPPDSNINRQFVAYAEVRPGPLNWTIFDHFEVTDSNTEYRTVASTLLPNTQYAFRIRVNYEARPYDKAIYFWPPDETRFMHRTLAYHPNQPSPPKVLHLKSGVYQVKWEKPNDNGAPITNYILQCNSSSKDKETWKTVYNGPQEEWRINTTVLEHEKPYVFRVAAVNSEGMGPFSEKSPVFMAPLVIENSMSMYVTVGVILGILAVLAVVILAIVFVLHKRREKIQIQQFIIRGPDTELATLRELPHTTFQQSNTLYAINIQCTDEEIAKLPHFSRSQLVLTIFLGSGAFGEVFEGLAKNIRGHIGGDTKCAVKTLRKSASDHEKEEFLKEALLMKNFQHEHILSLLGVCLDNDPQFIIMELMEGGDLLSFLRSCRATLTAPAKLILPDIVKICLHVSRGCKYLEDMHFVHRDLAARNCLVSTKSPADMTVKIGDFGLARDIYKNDYYRKEGEGLLPVRWMSPESLVDGFFTTQSDIWAFGVLMWEVVTLGQQPYPARTNIEVLHFVRDRGKLERPDKCADELYSLMSKCWNFLPGNRPCFANLVEDLEHFQDKCKQMSEAEITQYSPSFVDGGGSVRLTQSAKQKRLSDLLGSAETPEKLVVDLNKISRKRTHSLEDSKHSAKNIHFDVSTQDHFPAAGEYDHHGYLEPRGTKGGGRYLELMNYAPELLHLQDPYGNPLASGNGSAFLPVHVTHKGYHPSNVSYTLLSPDEDFDEANCHRSAGFTAGRNVNDKDDRSFMQTPTGQHYGVVSVESPLSSKSRSNHHHHHHSSTRTPEKQLKDYHHHSTMLSPAAMMDKSTARKYSDQDLYSCTVPYRQCPPSSTNGFQDHRYATVECNNNRSSTSCGSVSSDQDSVSESNGFMRNRQDSSSSFHAYTRAGLEHPLSVNLPASVDYENSKLSSSREAWANHLEDDNSVTSECGGDIVNHQGHSHHSSRSRGQVYPEKNSAALVGYGNSHVSLV